MALTIKGVTIGDKFRPNGAKNLLAEVVDFMEYRSMVTGEICGHTCIAKPINGMATNTFDTPFSTVIRYKVN